MAIDAHAHAFKRGLPSAENIRYAPDYGATPEDDIEDLDANGMSQGVLVRPSFLGTDDGYMLEALRRYPDRFRTASGKPRRRRARDARPVSCRC